VNKKREEEKSVSSKKIRQGKRVITEDFCRCISRNVVIAVVDQRGKYNGKLFVWLCLEMPKDMDCPEVTCSVICTPPTIHQ